MRDIPEERETADEGTSPKASDLRVAPKGAPGRETPAGVQRVDVRPGSRAPSLRTSLDAKKQRGAPLETIPERPTVALKEKRGGSGEAEGPAARGKVHAYDHANRFSKRYVPAREPAEKIDDEQLQVLTDYEGESDRLRRIERQDREAEERGRQALEREKTKRDYEDMLKKLPSVQKQEGLGKMYSDKPEYHMTEERLKEAESRKQLQMENAYENALPCLKPSIITVPPEPQAPRDDQEDKAPYRVVSISDRAPGKSVGSWDSERQREKGRAGTGPPDSCECDLTTREKRLTQLLLNLQVRR